MTEVKFETFEKTFSIFENDYTFKKLDVEYFYRPLCDRENYCFTQNAEKFLPHFFCEAFDTVCYQAHIDYDEELLEDVRDTDELAQDDLDALFDTCNFSKSEKTKKEASDAIYEKIKDYLNDLEPVRIIEKDEHEARYSYDDDSYDGAESDGMTKFDLLQIDEERGIAMYPDYFDENGNFILSRYEKLHEEE